MTSRSLFARARVTTAMAVLAGGVAFFVTGCTPAPSATPRVSPSASAEGSAGGSATPAVEPTLVPGGTAQQNLPFFDKVNRATLAAKPEAKGRDFIDALVAAGFAKADMQVTADTTTIGLAANSIQFSVKMGDTCLLGQNGADAGGYTSMTVAVLATNTCLIGQTRAIDW